MQSGSPDRAITVPAYSLSTDARMPDDYGRQLRSSHILTSLYNGNPSHASRASASRQSLIRVIGQGRWEHPFHEHGNHVRLLARDDGEI